MKRDASVPTPARIFVVDDLEEWRRIVRRSLAPQGYEVECFSDGASALAAVREAPPALLLLDVHMPKMTGYEVLSTLRSDERFEDLPVVLMTAEDRLQALVEGFKLGADDYLAKPIRRQELVARVSAILRVRDLQHQLREAATLAAKELDLARAVQQQILPLPLPERPGIRLAAAYRPCSALGGDFFDVVALPDDRTGLFVADVMGHGTSAALVTSFLKAQLLHVSQDASLSPPGLMSSLNRGVQAAFPDFSLFATAVYVEFDPAKEVVRYVSAGHPPPFLVRRDEPVKFLECGGLPLGYGSDCDYQAEEVAFGSGDRIVLHTDGIQEQSHHESRDSYGIDRLVEQVLGRAEDSPEVIVEHLEADLVAWAGGEPEDDINVVMMERCGGLV